MAVGYESLGSPDGASGGPAEIIGGSLPGTRWTPIAICQVTVNGGNFFMNSHCSGVLFLPADSAESGLLWRFRFRSGRPFFFSFQGVAQVERRWMHPEKKAAASLIQAMEFLDEKYLDGGRQRSIAT